MANFPVGLNHIGSMGGRSSGGGFFRWPGTVNNFPAIPDAPENSFAEDFSAWVEFSVDAFSGAQRIIGKDESPQRSWYFRLSGSVVQFAIPGVASPFATANLDSVGIVAGQRIWLGVTIDGDNDAADSDINFYYSVDRGATNNQLGSTVNAGSVIAFVDSTARIICGAATGHNPPTGNLYQAKLFNSIESDVLSTSNVAMHIDMRTQPINVTSFTESSPNEATVTVTRT